MRNITSYKQSLTTSLVIAVAGLGIAAIPAQADDKYETANRTLKVLNAVHAPSEAADRTLRVINCRC